MNPELTYDEMEQKIEARSERRIDRIDARFCRGEITEVEYDELMIAENNRCQSELDLLAQMPEVFKWNRDC